MHLEERTQSWTFDGDAFCDFHHQFDIIQWEGRINRNQTRLKDIMLLIKCEIWMKCNIVLHLCIQRRKIGVKIQLPLRRGHFYWTRHILFLSETEADEDIRRLRTLAFNSFEWIMQRVLYQVRTYNLITLKDLVLIWSEPLIFSVAHLKYLTKFLWFPSLGPTDRMIEAIAGDFLGGKYWKASSNQTSKQRAAPNSVSVICCPSIREAII